MEISDLKKTPEYKDETAALNSKAWPLFLLHWKCPVWKKLFTDFAEYQVLLLEEGKLLGFGHTIPIRWEKDLRDIPDDLRTLMEMGAEGADKGMEPNLLLALAAVISPEFKGRGLSLELLKAIKKLAAVKGIKNVILPTRPTLKYKYPLIPMEKYALWKRDDGSAFDPWTRAHFKMGGEIIKTSEACMKIEALVSNWEEWTGIAMPDTGEYIIDGGLRPISVDRRSNLGFYTVPCIWMRYKV